MVSPTLPQSSPTPLTRAQRAELLEFAAATTLSARTDSLAWFRTATAVINKQDGSGFDPVTIADRTVEQHIRTCIRKQYPCHGIFGEEYGYEPGEIGLTWVIDPIDGTRAFVCGLLHWGVLLALYDGQHPIVGACYQPYVDDLYLGDGASAEIRRDQGKQVQRLQTRACSAVAEATLCSTSPRLFTDTDERARFKALTSRVRDTRYGTDCYGYCMIAHGCVDVVVECNLAAYDVQAIIPIVEGAGGIVTNWRGDSAAHGGSIVACGDRALHTAVLEILA